MNRRKNIILLASFTCFGVLAFIIFTTSDKQHTPLNLKEKHPAFLSNPEIKNTLQPGNHHQSIDCLLDDAIEADYFRIREDNNLIRTNIQPYLYNIEPQFLDEISVTYALSQTEILGSKARPDPPVNPRSVVLQELKDVRQFLRLLKSQQYDEIVSQLQSGTIPLNTGLDGQYLVNWVLLLQPEITIDNLTKLLQTGVQINLTTLYVATKTGLEKEKISVLLPYLAENTISTIWRSNQHQVSLASVAAQMKRPDLVRFWSQQGSPVMDLNSDLNIALQIPWQQLNKDQTIEFTNLIAEMTNQIVPIYPVDYTVLRKVLNQQQIALFEQLPDVQKLSGQRWTEAQHLLSRLQQNNQSIQALVRCKPDLLQKQHLANAVTTGDSMITVMQKLYQEVSANEQDDPAIAIENALNKKQWKEALRLLRFLEVSEKNADIFSTAYFSMLDGEADFELLKEFIELYPTLPDHLMSAAAVYGHSRLARLLISKGADVHAKNKGGLTYLQLAAMNAPAAGNNMIDFFLQSGVSPHDGRGADPLSLLLLRAHDRDISVTKNYIQLFKRHGIIDTERYKKIVISNKHLTETNRRKIIQWL